MDHTGPYVRMLLERLRNPKSLSVMPPPPTAAGALEVHHHPLALPLYHAGMMIREHTRSLRLGVVGV